MVSKRIKNEIVTRIIRKLLNNESHRTVVQEILDEEFLRFSIDFFKKIVDSKMNDDKIDMNWYKENFLNDNNLKKEDVATNSGLNMKSISNMYNSGAKSVVIEASLEHYEEFYNTIQKLIEDGKDLEIQLTIKFKGVSVDLNVSETLIVINALAVKRSAIAGGLWSGAGKNVEKPLMRTLCKLFDVEEKYYSGKGQKPSRREIDFYIIDPTGNYHKTEVKLMGRGNPESADVIFARETEIFIGDVLSDTNKYQLDKANVLWISLNEKKGYKRFASILDYYNIPHNDAPADLNKKLDTIFEEGII